MFRDRIRSLVEGPRMARAQTLTQKFWSEPFTGRWFHVLADKDRPHEITAQDVVAVSTLSVTVPPRVAIWLLSDEGRAAVTQLLAAVPDDVDLWDGADLIDEGGDLWRLWRLLERACWPNPIPGNGMGPTTISKLLAAKRPHLVPIFDSVVRSLFPPVQDYWQAFYRATSDPQLRLELSIASAPGAPESAGLLRRLDALLWMIGQEPEW